MRQNHIIKIGKENLGSNNYRKSVSKTAVHLLHLFEAFRFRPVFFFRALRQNKSSPRDERRAGESCKGSFDVLDPRNLMSPDLSGEGYLVINEHIFSELNVKRNGEPIRWFSS